MFGLINLLLFSCQDSGDGKLPDVDSTLSLKITDSSVKNPFIESVEFEILKVEAIVNDLPYVLFEGPEVVEVFELGAGNQRELVNIPVKSGVLSQIRIYISNSNVVHKDGNLMMVEIPSAAQSGLKLVVTPTLEIIRGGVPYELTLDFNLAQSLIPEGTPTAPEGITGYKFKPVIRVANKTHHGNIRGKLYSDMCSSEQEDDQIMENVIVKAFKNGRFVFATQTNLEGAFSLIGLDPGDYDIVVEAELHKSLQFRQGVWDITDSRVSLTMAGDCISLFGQVLSDAGTTKDFYDDFALEGALVRIFDENNNLLEELVSGENGAFQSSSWFRQDLEVEALESEHFSSSIFVVAEQSLNALNITLESLP